MLEHGGINWGRGYGKRKLCYIIKPFFYCFLIFLVFSGITNFSRLVLRRSSFSLSNRQVVENLKVSSLIISQCEFVLIFNGCLISSIYFTKNLHQIEYILFWKMNRQDLQTLMIHIRRQRLWGLRILTSLHL